MISWIIVIDMGNTGVSMALARPERLLRRLRLDTAGLSGQTVSNALSRLARGRRIGGSILCSVVPDMNRLWIRELLALTGREPMLVHHRLRLGIGIALPKPGEIGADRLANACAVSHLHGTPAIAVDFGTALTFDVVSKEKKYIGGVIAPGLPLMTDYFAERTALLPRVSIVQRGLSVRPGMRTRGNPAVGTNTVEAMLIGARAGYLGMVREILARLRRHLGNRRIRVCATGGYADWILSGSSLRIAIDHDLTLRGISRIYELNRRR